jgi:hypothetical protein
MATYGQIRQQGHWSLALGVLFVAALLVGSASANSLRVRAVDQNGVQIEVTFPGAAVDSLDGSVVAAHRYDESNCTGSVLKFLPDDVTTLDAPSTDYVTLGNGWTVTGDSIKVQAPTPVTDDGVEYVFSHWTVDSNGSLQNPPDTSNPACFNGWDSTIATNVTATTGSYSSWTPAAGDMAENCKIKVY